MNIVCSMIKYVVHIASLDKNLLIGLIRNGYLIAKKTEENIFFLHYMLQ
jgi:hypothetical protein